MSGALASYLGNENVQKFLRTIAQAEGTVKDGANPYQVGFGGAQIQDLSAHPNIRKQFRQTDGKTNVTTAAGAYQFIKPTWDGLQKRLNLPDFSPRSQDIAAVALLQENGALPYVLKGDFETAVVKSGPTWASLPSSPYAQPKRTSGFIRTSLGNTPNKAQPMKAIDVSKIQWDDAPSIDKNSIVWDDAPQKQPAQQSLVAQQPAQQQGNKRGFAAELARQLGLTGRYALEGGAQALEVFSEPMRYVTDRVLGGAGKSVPASELARRAADAIGLPQPENKLERVVGDGTRMGFGAMLPMGLANKFAPLAKGNVAKAIVAGVAENPAAQIGGGVGSGLASGAAREAGADKGLQAVAGVIGGIGGGMAGNRAMKIVGRPSEYIANKFGVEPLPQTLKPRQMSNDTLSQVLRSKISITGGDWDKIPKQVQQSIIADVRKANNLDNLDAQAMRRLADFRALGITPTRGTVTLDPVQITREKNLAKAGANSGLVNTHGMAQVENANNNRLVQLLQGVEGNGETDATAAGNAVLNSILGKRDTLRGAEDAAWEAAKASPGYTRPIDSGVLGDINQALGDSAMMPFMDARISSYIKALQENPEQWTPAAYRNLQSMLAKAANAGGNEGYAAGVARRALENAQMRAGGAQFVSDGLPITQRAADIIRTADDNAGRTVDLIDNARRATRQAYEFEGSSNVVKAALADGADPASLAKRFVINGNDTEAATVLQNLSPQGRQVVRNAIATHIKKKALGGAADEVGNVSQKALNSTINGIGKNKLGLFFTPEEMEQLSRIGRVASYVQVQPTGSAVNNSNSGAMVVGKAIDLLGGLTSKIPLLNINQQVDSLINVGRTRTALDATKGIYTMPQNRFGLLPSAARGGLVGGLLVAPSDREDDRKRN